MSTKNQRENRDTATLAKTINGACQSLSIGRSTLYELIGSGELRAIKVRNRTLIPTAELERLIDERMAVKP
ncbi:helix-turn-helix domain-containing protein [Lysobacter soli]|uniref:helix-turn-helix domain-containing protein n=1 Tax=Lysobacter soli TaxID=453783 RepID=UPI0037C97B88